MEELQVKCGEAEVKLQYVTNIPRAPVVPPQVRYDWTLLAPTPVPPS